MQQSLIKGNPEENTGSWDDGAYRALYTKEEPITLEKGGTYTKISMDRGYSGMWLKITLQTQNDTLGDLLWSDEKDIVKWIHLPYIKKNADAVSDDNVEIYDQENTDTYQFLYKKIDAWRIMIYNVK